MKEEQRTKVLPISLKRLKLRLRSPLNPHVVTTQELEELENLAFLCPILSSLYVYFRSLVVLPCLLGWSSIYSLQSAFNLT